MDAMDSMLSWRSSLGMLASQVHSVSCFSSVALGFGLVVSSITGSATGAGVVLSLLEAILGVVSMLELGSMMVHSCSIGFGMYGNN
jgi:hypothetical protein